MDRIIDANNLIYNRFDVIHADALDNIEIFYMCCEGIEYEVQLYFHKHVADINIWGKDLPETVVDRILLQLEERHPNVYAINIQRGTRNYNECLMKGKEVILQLPATEDELASRLSKKERYNIRRAKRFGGQGEIYTKIYNENEITKELVELFFLWKRITHGTNYQLDPNEYIKKYHVTNAMEMGIRDSKMNEQAVAVLFWCACGDTVYFENFSYDRCFEKYSPGYLIYIEFLKELIKQNYHVVFLGGAGYEYKKKFFSVERECYSGYLFTKHGIDSINAWISANKINNWGIYGGGNLGKAVLKVSEMIEKKPSFVIDKNPRYISGINVISPNDNYPKNDLVVIAVAGRKMDIENILSDREQKYLYCQDIINEIMS